MLMVKLPDLPTVPKQFRNQQMKVSRLLISGDTNFKLNKGQGEEYQVWGLSLAPAKLSGYNVCSSSTEGCRDTCLFFQGRGFFPAVMAGRIARTIAFKEHRSWFLATLLSELAEIEARSKKENFRALVRLNVLSDVMWEKGEPSLFKFDIQTYDYTKHVRRMLRFCEGGLPPSYHLTFSRSEVNDDACREVLAAGGNVAVVFKKRLPKRWYGRPVIDGDVNDWRFNDPDGVVVGLLAKGTARTADEGFVVDPGRVPLALAV